MVGADKKQFQITLDKEWRQGKYIMGYDPYKEDSESYSLGILQNPKKVFGIKKIRGFKRVVELGYEWIVRLCQ